MLLLLFLSLAAAEFLSEVVKKVDNSTFPEFCFEENVISCVLVRPNPTSLLSSSLELAGSLLELLDHPSENTFTFATGDGGEAIFTIDKESGDIWDNAELADGRDFVLEPSPDSCRGCHVWIEEDRKAFHLIIGFSCLLQLLRSHDLLLTGTLRSWLCLPRGGRTRLPSSHFLSRSTTRLR